MNRRKSADGVKLPHLCTFLYAIPCNKQVTQNSISLVDDVTSTTKNDASIKKLQGKRQFRISQKCPSAVRLFVLRFSFFCDERVTCFYRPYFHRKSQRRQALSVGDLAPNGRQFHNGIRVVVASARIIYQACAVI